MTFNSMLLATVATGLVLTSTLANASDVVPVGVRVANDNQPSLGLHAGGFYIAPKITAEETYNDNVYATQNNQKNDFITTVRPEVAARSNWSRHALNARAGAEWNKYANHDGEDNTNYLGAVDGRLDVMKDTYIGGGASAQRLHEDRGDPNSLGSSAKPTAYNLNTVNIGAYRGLGRFNARIDSDVKNYDFKNGYSTTGGFLNNGLRDRNEWTQSARVGYKATPGTEVFVKGNVDSRAYDAKGSAANVNRSSHGNSVVGGVEIDLTGKTKAEAHAGYMHRNYTDATRKDITEPTYGGKLTWNASDLTTVTAAVDTTIEETVVAGSSAYVNRSFNVGVEHALARNVVLNGDLGYANNDYKGFAAGQRNDDIYSVNAGAKYYLNRNLAAGLGYRFRDRQSNVAGSDYDRNAIMLSLTGTY